MKKILLWLKTITLRVFLEMVPWMSFVNEIIKYSTVTVCYWVDEKETRTLVSTAQNGLFLHLSGQ